MKIRLFLLLILISTSCAQVRSVSQTSIPLKKGKIIKAEVEKNIFFFLNFDTSYVEQLTKELLKKCPNGNIEGVFTKDVALVYFPIVFHKDHIFAEAYCVE